MIIKSEVLKINKRKPALKKGDFLLPPTPALR